MKLQRILIWTISLFLAYFAGRTVIRNIWRLYKSPLDKAILIQGGCWKISNSSAQLNFSSICFQRQYMGLLDDHSFDWTLQSASNKIKISELKGENSRINGLYSLSIWGNDQNLVLENKSRSIVGKFNSYQIPNGFHCGFTLSRSSWESNQRIPWF